MASFVPYPSPFPKRTYPDPIPQGPNRGPLPQQGEFPKRDTIPSPIPQGPNRGPLEQPSPFPKRTDSVPVGMATSPLAGTRQTMGGGAQAALTDRLMAPAPAPPMAGPSQTLGGGAEGFLLRNRQPPDINGNDIPEPPVTTDPDNPGGPVVGGGDPQMPVVLPDDQAGTGGGDPNPAPPDASRWLHTGGAAPGSLSALIQARLEELLNQGPVDPNSEDIKNVVNAARVQERRQGDRARAAMMERRAATGLAGGGGTDTGILGIEQGIGERLGGLSAGMVREAQINRANQIMQALTLGQGRIDAEQQRALQSELANIQATLQREGMALQNSQFEAQMSMQALLAMLAGLGGN